MNTRKPVILVAPLDWGLGHTARCIPIISELLYLECEVLVACNSDQRLFLEIEFPTVRFVNLNGYNIYYGQSRWKTRVNLAKQVPKILTGIKQEKTWLDKFLMSNKIDAVISDNRYGLFSSSIPCIFITHQLQVKTGLGRFIDNRAQKFLYKFIDRFRECWVPDWKESNSSAAGELSHPRRMPRVPVHYIGCLSRLDGCFRSSEPNNLLIVLSGPEPQRSILEAMLRHQLGTFSGHATLVRGVANNSEESLPPDTNLAVVGRASQLELNELFCKAEVIICRSGYTSIMDIMKLGRKSILIPTPGQAEQEYLGKHLHKRRIAVVARQEEFSLEVELKKIQEIRLPSGNQQMEMYKQFVGDFVESLRARKYQSASADFGNSKK